MPNARPDVSPGEPKRVDPFASVDGDATGNAMGRAADATAQHSSHPVLRLFAPVVLDTVWDGGLAALYVVYHGHAPQPSQR